MTAYKIFFSKQARKDVEKLTVKQKAKLQDIIVGVLAENPYEGKALKGDLEGLHSFRLNRKDRILYEIYEEDKSILIIRARTHCGE